MLHQDPHPLLQAVAFRSQFPSALSASPPWVMELFKGPAPFQSSEEVRGAIRDLLRQGGFKPTGRSKPASEYLLKAVEEGRLGTINLSVDLCNLVSYHSGLPISVVDLAKAKAPFRIGLASPGNQYVFNASGQEIDIGGLLCLFDAEGPCANAVKDSQRTKTDENTRETLTILWGSQKLGSRTEDAYGWYRQLLEQAGATITRVDIFL